MISIDQKPVTKDYIEDKKLQINKSIKRYNMGFGTVVVFIFIASIVFFVAAEATRTGPPPEYDESVLGYGLLFFMILMVEGCLWGMCEQYTDARKSEFKNWSYIEKKDCIKLLDIGKKRLEIGNYLNSIAALDRAPTKGELDMLVDYDLTYDIKKSIAERKAAEEAAAEKACVLILSGEI